LDQLPQTLLPPTRLQGRRIEKEGKRADIQQGSEVLISSTRSCIYGRNQTMPARKSPCTCENGPEIVSFHHSSPGENRGADHGPRLPSRSFVAPQPHVGVLTRSLPEVLKCCGVVQRQPGVADAMIEAYICTRVFSL